MRKEQQRQRRMAAKAAARQNAQKQQFASRSIQEQQAALHLAQFANKEKDIGLDQTSVDALCLSLTVSLPLSFSLGPTLFVGLALMFAIG